ncbi:MAG: IS630 family transposase, partial [Boseongicola sp.]|nr:IS630 family transposase [Boseongicola sp.]
MPAKILVSRTDHTLADLRELASKNKFRDCRRRLRAIALVIEGELSRAGIADGAGVDAQTLCDWVKRYNGGGIDGLRDEARPPMLDGARTATVASWLEAGPDPEAGEPSRWTVADIRERIMDSFGVRYTLEGARRLMLRVGFRHVSPRPIHPKADPEAQKAFRNGFAQLAEAAVPDGVSTEDVLVYFQDEARIGQKGMLSRVWARNGTRPRIVRDHRCGYACLFSAACPESGTAVGHVCAKANTVEMSRHLREIGEQVPAGKHALVVLDGAGWHRSRELEIPNNVSLLRLPPCSPELNPVETLFSVL